MRTYSFLFYKNEFTMNCFSNLDIKNEEMILIQVFLTMYRLQFMNVGNMISDAMPTSHVVQQEVPKLSDYQNSNIHSLFGTHSDFS